MESSYYVDSMGRKCIDKAPTEELDYGMDVTDILAESRDGDYIVSASITVGEGLTKRDEEFSQTRVRCFIEGGTAKQKIPVVMTAVTNQTRTIVRTIYIVIVAEKNL